MTPLPFLKYFPQPLRGLWLFTVVAGVIGQGLRVVGVHNDWQLVPAGVSFVAAGICLIANVNGASEGMQQAITHGAINPKPAWLKGRAYPRVCGVVAVGLGMAWIWLSFSPH